MIQKAKFLGVSIHDRSRRRALVLAYYGLMLLILSVGLYKQRFLPMVVIIQTLTLGGFFGGIRSESVVKPYSENTPTPGESGIQQLNLNGIRPFTGDACLTSANFTSATQLITPLTASSGGASCRSL